MSSDWMLAIEVSNPTSGPRGTAEGVLAGPGVALGREGRAIDVELLGEGPRHDDDLMPAIARLCERNKVGARDLETVAVSSGPGGYTSLRIAVATAKMIAEAAGAKVVAVPSARVAAWCIPIGPPAIVCLASKNTTVHATILPDGPLWWREKALPIVERLRGTAAAEDTEARLRSGMKWIAAACELGEVGAEVIEALGPRLLIADRFLPEPIHQAALRIGASIVEPIFAAASLVAIAVGLPAIDPLELLPTYPREPEAVTKWRELRK